MFDGTPTFMEMLFGIAAFALVLSLWIGMVMILNALRQARIRKLERRLGFDADERRGGRVLTLWDDKEERSVVVPDDHHKATLRQKLTHFLRQAGLEVPLRTVVLGLMGAMLMIGLMMYAVSGNLLLSAASSLALLILFKIYLSQCVSRRSARFEQQFVNAMELASRSLRAGHPLIGAFSLVAEEMTPPVSNVFAEICQHHELGLSIDEALQRAAGDSRTPEMELFATSVGIQMRTGGNLADMMERLAFVVRDRMRLSRRVRVLTAQTQLSKRALLALPICLFLLLNVIAADYMSTFFVETAGQVMLGSAAAGMILGAWAMNWLADLKY